MSLQYDDAVTIHWQHLEGQDVQQPCRALSKYVRGVWYLRNVNGHLGRVGCRSKRATV